MVTRQRRGEARALQPGARALRAGRRGGDPRAVLGQLPGAGADHGRDAGARRDARRGRLAHVAPRSSSARITPKTKAVILCTPVEPHGRGVRRGSEMRALLDVLRAHDCWLVVDEIYAELVYDGFKHVSAAKLAPDLRARMIDRRRRVEVVRDDGLAHRLVDRAAPAHQGARRGAGPEHDQPERGRAVRGARGAHRAARRGREDARRVREAPRRDGRGAELVCPG